MNRREQLIAETIGHDGENFARLAAAHVRRRRIGRRAVLAATAASALVLAVILTRRPPVPVTPAPLAPIRVPAFEIMSDADLLAQLKDQPVLVLKDGTGITGIIFLAKEAKL